MLISTHIVIAFIACGSLLALITERYPLELSRLLENTFDCIECRLAANNDRRRRTARTRTVAPVRRSASVETLADFTA